MWYKANLTSGIMGNKDYKQKFLSVEMTKTGLRYLNSPAHSKSSFRPKENVVKLKLKLMLDEKTLINKS